MACFSLLFSQKKEQMMKEWEHMHESKAGLFKEYNDLKFGMFIHWGVYSQLGGIWNGVKIVPETHRWATIGEWIMYSARIPRAAYREVAKTFNPVDFDAEEWVKLAKEAGMRYIVITSKHHDGFAMYHSEVSDYNIYDLTQFKRDPIAELHEACKKHGIRLGLYYSHSIDWMDGGDSGNAQAKAANPQSAGQTHSTDQAANDWDPSPLSFEEYIEQKAKPQVREILTEYPGLVEIWYDFPRNMNLQQSFEFYQLAYEYQPGCLVNSRVGNNLGDYLVAGDNKIPTTVDTRYKTWETPGTLNNTWGYKSYDDDWKSVDEVLFWIVEIASKGGNYLLNVGPDGKGVIPEASVETLKGIGEWMKINGEAIYGTSKWTTMKEGPTEWEAKGTTYRREHGFNTAFTPEDFWFTIRGDKVYIISLASPAGGTVDVASLYDCRNKIRNIKLLGGKGSLKWQVSGEKVVVELPPVKNDHVPGFVLRAELE
jgi:alpha-L-fucosidase